MSASATLAAVAEHAASSDLKDAAIGAASNQFAIFHMQGEMFAVPLSEVKEIVRVPEIVRMPMAPASMEGLANLRGVVLPILNLREVFGMPPVMNDDATRVVVLDHSSPVGFVVDRVANVVTVEESQIASTDSIKLTVDTDLLDGLVRTSDGHSIIMILDSMRLVEREFSAFASNSDKSRISKAEESWSTKSDTSVTGHERQLVSFEVGGQEYAFPIDVVQEIVQLPETITEVPKSAGHVMGLIMLRNRLLPLVSLREKFGVQSQVPNRSGKVVVISLDDAGDVVVGVVMDSVKEVLRVDENSIDEMPPLLARDGENAEVTAVCRLEDGKRLVSVLAVERMFNAAEISETTRATQEMTTGGPSEASGATAGRDDEEQFVIFKMMHEEFGVPIGVVQEIVRIPNELTKVPNTPEFIEGVVNLRGVVLPVIDQRRRFSQPPIDRNDRQRIIVLSVRGVQTGIIVDSVSEVLRIPANAISASPSVCEDQRRVFKRVANLEREKRMILLIDVEHLLNVEESAIVSKAIH